MFEGRYSSIIAKTSFNKHMIQYEGCLDFFDELLKYAEACVESADAETRGKTGYATIEDDIGGIFGELLGFVEAYFTTMEFDMVLSNTHNYKLFEEIETRISKILNIIRTLNQNVSFIFIKNRLIQIAENNKEVSAFQRNFIKRIANIFV